MAEPKYSLLQDIEIVICNSIEDEELRESIIDKITEELQKYDVTARCTDLVTYTHEDFELLKRYCACLILEGKAKSTVEGYRYRLSHMLNELQIHFKDIGAYDIRYYLAQLKFKGYADITLESVRTYISAFYTWMVNEELLNKSPCAQIKPIKFSTEIKKEFSDLDIEKIRSHCKNVKERAIVELFLSSGIRVAELSQMNIQDLDFHTYAVHVKHGKGDKARITYMSPVASYYIKQYLSTRKDDDEALFRSRRGRLNSGGVRFILKKLGERAKVDKVHPHRFRRTFATTLSNRGMPIQMVQHLMGHSNLDTTMVYVNISENSVRSEYLKYMQA